MTTATSTRTSQETSRTVHVTLDDAPLLDYGQSGHLAPHEGSVRVSTYDDATSYLVSLDAKNANGIPLHGTWGWPRATSIPSHDYGHGGAGLVSDLPADLLAILSAATGIDLTHLTAK